MGPSRRILPLFMLAILTTLGPFFNRILFKLEVLTNKRVARYSGDKMNKQRVVQGHTGKVA
jgi:hypothetical protein